MFPNIYGLYDPRNPEVIMYVGKGSEKRPEQHWSGFLSQRNYVVNKRLRKWFEGLKAEGIRPSWRFLEKNVVNWPGAERRFIALWRNLNPGLCNVLEGGNAFSGLSYRLSHNQAVEAGRKGNRRMRELYPNLSRDTLARTRSLYPEKFKESPRKAGLASIRKGGGWKLAHKRHPELMRKAASHAGHVSRERNPGMAEENGRRTAHLVQHLRRNRLNLKCIFCVKNKKYENICLYSGCGAETVVLPGGLLAPVAGI